MVHAPALVAHIPGREIKIETDPFYCNMAGMFFLLAEAENIDMMVLSRQAGQLPGEILYMDPRPSINMGRILIRQNGDSHKFLQT